MEELKHVCKFCSKSFSCGRSLGGHMRSHMINDVTSLADGTKLTKKKLPPLINGRSVEPSSSSYELRENPRRTWRIPVGREKQQQEQEEEEQESWDSVMDSHSDDNQTNVAAMNRGKRSQRKMKQIMGTAANSSSSLCFANRYNNDSSSISEIDHEQEEVAISLMMLSRDVSGFAESSDNNSVFVTKAESRKPKLSVSGIPRKGISQLDDESVVENSGIESGKRKFIDDCFNPNRNNRFECTTCNKIFHSYQALGGHKASHKKNKGCITSTIESTENSIETVQISPIKSENSVEIEPKKRKEHICTICSKEFPSGQALGGHKRSHLAKNEQNLLAIQEPIRDFLDLNLPAPCEEDNNGFNQWWTARHEPLLGLISN